jgi:hypothetical protein
LRVAFVIPSANATKCGETFARWKSLGYETYVLVDGGTPVPTDSDVALRVEEYEGYAKSVNLLAKLAVADGCEIVVTGGDDVLPIPSLKAQEIGRQFREHFPDMLGIMEPCGDRHMVDAAGLCAAERVCIAPWMGSEWVRRGYGGKGPLHEGYWHFFVDEEIKNVAEKLGILWQRSDLTQYHDHWTRGRQRPEYLDKAAAGWAEAKSLFESRQAAGFPGHELSAAE